MKHALLAFLIALPLPAVAFETVTNRDAFLSLVSGKRLTGDGVSLQVAPDGSISGRGFGLRVRGTWTWEGGFFCRTLDTVLRDFPRNCQRVSTRGSTIRFHADQGTGDIADLAIR